MTIYDFVSEDELDDLPEDPSLAFLQFVRTAERKLALKTGELEHEEQWQSLKDTRHSFMNIVVAAAKRYKFEPFVSLEVPRITRFNDDVFRQFKADLDHFLTQLALDKSIRTKRDSVYLPDKSKDRIRSHIYGLKTCIDESNFTDAKKSALLSTLADFESQLSKQRLSLISVARLAFEILAVPGALWASADITNKLVTNMLEEVGEAKAAEDESRKLPPIEVPAALSPPRHEDSEDPRSVDDEMPF